MIIDTCILIEYTLDSFLFHCSVVIWDIERKEALCGHQAAMQSAGAVTALTFSKHSDDIFATGGE